MSDFSIEMAAERIIDQRTRAYFEEVQRSYAGGNFRSAVVMLWSVVVCDLLYKLDELSTAYSDVAACGIMTEIEVMRGKNPKSPEWETALLDKINVRTHLRDAVEYSNTHNLQVHRHSSAHPVLTATYELFSPSREATRAHIRNALEGVLTKPPIMSKKVFEAFVEDLEAKRDILPDVPSLKRYLEAKYFPHFVPQVEKAIFRSLWRLVFKLTDVRCETNRTINLRALHLLYDRRPKDFNDLISKEKAYFSEFEFTGTAFDSLHVFLRSHPPVFKLLSEAARTPIENSDRADFSNFSIAWFLSDTLDQHLAVVLEGVRDKSEEISRGKFTTLYKAAQGQGVQSKVLDIGIELYGHSGSFDTADMRFDYAIEPYLNDITSLQLLRLLEVTESNGQVLGRGRARGDHGQVKSAIDRVLGANYALTNYVGFRSSIGLT